MIRIPVFRFGLATMAAAVLLSAGASAVTTPRRIFVGAIDSKGTPVTDLTAADLAVKEGGRNQKIDAVQPATDPMHVAMIIDDGGTGAFQGSASEFLNKMAGQAQFAVRLVDTQAIKIQDYTADFESLKTMLGKLGQRGRVRPDGDQLLEAVNESARELQKRKAARPIIVAFTVFGEAGKAIDPQSVLNTLRDTGVQLNVLYVTGASTGQMIGDGTKQSGGHVEEVYAGAGLQPGAAKMADILLHQFAVTYTLPDGTRPSERVSVSTSRKGITLLAPTRISVK